MDIPLNSLIPSISPVDDDRNRLSNIKGLGYVVRLQPTEEEKYPLSEVVTILGTKPVSVLFLTTLFRVVGGAITGSLLIFFYSSVLNNELRLE